MSDIGAIVEGQVQSRKTAKAFDVVVQKYACKQNVLCLFVCQANNTASVSQLVQRASSHDGMNAIFKFITNDHKMNARYDANTLIAGYWHSRVRKAMLNALEKNEWEHVLVVIDEVDQGGQQGCHHRMLFLDKIAASRKNASLFSVFITATVANLCKSITIVNERHSNEYMTQYMRAIIGGAMLEHYYVIPSENYVGASYFLNSEEATWKLMTFPKKPKKGAHQNAADDENGKNAKNVKEGVIVKNISELEDHHKKLCLVAVSYKRDEHRSLASKLLTECGFNVVVQLNSNASNTKDYVMTYKNESNVVKKWNVPYVYLETLFKQGKFANVICPETGCRTDTVLTELTLSHVLCTCVMMGTKDAKEIKKHVGLSDWRCLMGLYMHISRPSDYPSTDIRCAIVSGNMIGRGITIQSASLGFVCSAFVFTDTNDKKQRGANNCQRVGRACGLIKEVLMARGNKPVMIATAKVMQDAIANEDVSVKKGSVLKDADLICLNTLISDQEWKHIQRDVGARMKVKGERDKKSKIKRIVYKGSIDDTIRVTRYSRLTYEEMMELYALSSIPDNANKLAALLAPRGINANISYKKSTAAQVSNMCNYYKNPHWAGKNMQIVRFEEDRSFAMIERDIGVLDDPELRKGSVLSAHDEYGNLCYYEVNV